MMEGKSGAQVKQRLRWSPAEKAALLAEIEAESGQVSVIAKRHGIPESLLYIWRSEQASSETLARNSSDCVQFRVIVPSQDEALTGSPKPVRGVTWSGCCAGSNLADRIGAIEIELPHGIRIRIYDGVSEKTLRRVLHVMNTG